MTKSVRLSVMVCLVLLAAAAVVLMTKQNPVSVVEVRKDVAPIEPEMVEIPGGPVRIGNPGGTAAEKPVREIHVTAFSIGKYEVTNEEYRRFCDATGREYPPDPEFAEGQSYFLTKPRHPAVMMSWTDMAAYCMWLSKRTGKDYHLPTNAQWEKAMRGGKDGETYPWGEERLPGMARMNLTWSEGTVEVGQYPPNGFGLHDMAGNVNEAVADWYVEDYYSWMSASDPTGPSGFRAYLSLVNPSGTRSRLKGRCRVVRGGSYRAPWDWFMNGPDGRPETPVQCGAREYLYQEPYTHFDLGFRVALGGVH